MEPRKISYEPKWYITNNRCDFDEMTCISHAPTNPVYVRTPMTKKQQKARKAAKTARKARKRNR